MNKIHIHSYTGSDSLPYADALAKLRISVFREWPYLYEGSLEYEQHYLPAFCAVERTADDPRRPQDYHPLDNFWTKRGYTKHSKIKATFDWREIGQSLESPHTLTFWIKEI